MINYVTSDYSISSLLFQAFHHKLNLQRNKASFNIWYKISVYIRYNSFPVNSVILYKKYQMQFTFCCRA